MTGNLRRAIEQNPLNKPVRTQDVGKIADSDLYQGRRPKFSNCKLCGPMAASAHFRFYAILETVFESSMVRFRRRMARTYLAFGDIAGKLHILRIECTQCERKGRYSVAKLLAQYGRSGNMSKWVSDLRATARKRNTAQPVRRSSFISS